jgi:hypothetical protein
LVGLRQIDLPVLDTESMLRLLDLIANNLEVLQNLREVLQRQAEGLSGDVLKLLSNANAM